MPRGENRPSVLLTRDENEVVFSLIGPKCQSLATGVVQLFTTEGPGHSEWKKKDTGVLCLIKDNSRRSYFFRIYCLHRRCMIWEHEVYMQIEYKSPRPYLHTFEAEEYMTAFNFANEDEARILRNILIEKIELRKQRREERRQRTLLAQRANNAAAQNHTNYNTGSRQNGVPPPTPAPMPAPVPSLPPKSTVNSLPGGYTIKSTSKKPKTRKLTKADIGMPQDFKHISHVGWDANKGFDVDNLPEEEMRTFFSKVGISETQLQDQATRQFIYDFINTHGGLDAVKEELHETKPSSKSSSSVPSAPRGGPPPAPPAPPAPPVPTRSPAPPHPPAPPSRAPPPPPARVVPPPPPPPAAPSAAPHPPRNPPPPRPTPPLTAPPTAPPPPPPPPPPGQAPPPPPAPPAPPMPMPQDSAVPVDARAALMESIKSGSKNLRKVEVGAKPVVDDSRSNLLSEIRQGVELRSVPKSAQNPSAERPRGSGGGASGLADALKRALDERSKAIHSDSDSDDDNDTTSEGEWD